MGSKLHLYRVVAGEAEAETKRLAFVQRVVVENPDVHLPALKIVRLYEGDACATHDIRDGNPGAVVAWGAACNSPGARPLL